MTSHKERVIEAAKRVVKAHWRLDAADKQTSSSYLASSRTEWAEAMSELKECVLMELNDPGGPLGHRPRCAPCYRSKHPLGFLKVGRFCHRCGSEDELT